MPIYANGFVSRHEYLALTKVRQIGNRYETQMDELPLLTLARTQPNLTVEQLSKNPRLLKTINSPKKAWRPSTEKEIEAWNKLRKRVKRRHLKERLQMLEQSKKGMDREIEALPARLEALQKSRIRIQKSLEALRTQIDAI